MTNTLPTLYQQVIHKSRYARFIDELGRREHWNETVARYFDFFQGELAETLGPRKFKETRTALESAVLGTEVLPSMRCLMTAGPALARDNVCAYNCSYVPIDNLRAFDEILVILMSGTGVGFSVERNSVNELPVVPSVFTENSVPIMVEDSKPGWQRAFRQLISALYMGGIPKWDLSKLRPSGARLKIMGGRSSGPEPLNDLFNFTVATVTGAKGRKLLPIECHDLACKIGDIVVVGGVRRSALISLSDLGDADLRNAKSGEWWSKHPHRALANNSAVHYDGMDVGQFMDEWSSLYASNSGERGIFNRDAVERLIKELAPRRELGHVWGTNPCSEINLRPYQFCNLTTVVVRATDTIETLKAKVEAATILGTMQSTLTKFPYLRNVWRRNTEEERLLGVSLTGSMDSYLLNPLLNKDFAEVAQLLKKVAVETNEVWADKLDIEPSTAITCVKPEGTTSQLVDAASGLHARYAPYYIRRIRGDSKDPLVAFLKDAGVPHEKCVVKPESVTVFSFPVKSPTGAMIGRDISAVDQLSVWKEFQLNWCEHKPSVTISVKPDEWLDAAAFVWKNRKIVSGVSFLPFDGGSYKQAPYEEIDKNKYEEMSAAMPKTIDWDRMADFEKEDATTAAQDLACVAGVCSIETIGNPLEGSTN